MAIHPAVWSKGIVIIALPQTPGAILGQFGLQTGRFYVAALHIFPDKQNAESGPGESYAG